MPYKDKAKHNSYLKEHRREVKLSLMKTTDIDLIDWLEAQPSMQGAIKDALRYYIKHSNT